MAADTGAKSLNIESITGRERGRRERRERERERKRE